MSIEDNKAVVGRWFTEFWGKDFNPAVIDELAAPDIRFEYSLHAPLQGREAVRAFAEKFRAAFPDLNFWGSADLIAERGHINVAATAAELKNAIQRLKPLNGYRWIVINEGDLFGASPLTLGTKIGILDPNGRVLKAADLPRAK